MGISFTQIVVVLLVVVLLFGAKRIPEIARAFGRASNEFKKAKEGLEAESRDLAEAAQKVAAQEDAVTAEKKKKKKKKAKKKDGEYPEIQA